METPDDKLSRVRQMLSDRGQTWDLSPNDQVAIKHVLGLVNYLAEFVSILVDRDIVDIMDKANLEVAKIQSNSTPTPSRDSDSTS